MSNGPTTMTYDMVSTLATALGKQAADDATTATQEAIAAMPRFIWSWESANAPADFKVYRNAWFDTVDKAMLDALYFKAHGEPRPPRI